MRPEARRNTVAQSRNGPPSPRSAKQQRRPDQPATPRLSDKARLAHHEQRATGTDPAVAHAARRKGRRGKAREVGGLADLSARLRESAEIAARVTAEASLVETLE
jgi:hypothetical protein